jgi:hypothetical protein
LFVCGSPTVLRKQFIRPTFYDGYDGKSPVMDYFM